VLRAAHATRHMESRIKASLRGIARALLSFMGNVSEEQLPEKLATLSERLTTSSDQDHPTESGIGRVQMSQRSAKSAAELESMIVAESPRDLVEGFHVLPGRSGQTSGAKLLP
jgi:hypothetical protein